MCKYSLSNLFYHWLGLVPREYVSIWSPQPSLWTCSMVTLCPTSHSFVCFLLSWEDRNPCTAQDACGCWEARALSPLIWWPGTQGVDNAYSPPAFLLTLCLYFLWSAVSYSDFCDEILYLSVPYNVSEVKIFKYTFCSDYCLILSGIFL